MKIREFFKGLTNMEKAMPRIRGEKIIIAALLMILAAEIGKAVWPMAAIDSESTNAIRNFIAQNNSPKNMLVDALNLFGFFLLTISLIATGVRCVRGKWKSIKGITFTIIGLGIFVYHIAEIQFYKSIGTGLDDIKRPNYEIAKSRVEQENLPINVRSKLSKAYAQDKYLHEGKLVEYISETGEPKPYEPTAKDIKSLNLQNNAKRIWDYNNKRLPKLFQLWVAVGVISIALGVFTPIRKAAPNPRSDHDRA